MESKRRAVVMLAEHGVQFYAPMVANGKVYFGTRGHLYAYGLLSKSQPN